MADFTTLYADDLARDTPPARLADSLRVAELGRLQIMDTEPEDRFDRIVALVRVLFDAPGASISLIDMNRQWLKSRSGMGASVETPRGFSFCNHAIEGHRVFVVPDATQDDRFSGNPLVEGPPYIRFYAGAPLRTGNGTAIGALCILSPEARDVFSPEDQQRLEALAGIVTNEMELRLQAKQTEGSIKTREEQLKRELGEAHYRIKNKLGYSDLIAEIQTGDMSTEKLAALATAAWEQHIESNGVLTSAIRALRDHMSPADYKQLLKSMPGFTM